MTAFTTPEQIDRFRLAVMRSAIRLKMLGLTPNAQYTWTAIARTVSRITGEEFTGKKDAAKMIAAINQILGDR